jgi:hypothetical protein
VQLGRSEVENPLGSNLCPILNTVDHLIVGRFYFGPGTDISENTPIFWRKNMK